MMSKPTVLGVKDVSRRIRRLEDAVSKTSARSELKSIHAESAKIVEKDAVPRVPARSGQLRSTLRSSGTARTGVVRAGYQRVPYAGVVHFGWPARNIPPQPFLYDAKDARRGQVYDLFQRRLNDLVRKFDLD